MKWITIEEYAFHHKVSLSSLKEKIKSGDIEYQFSAAKCFIKDQPLSEQNPFDKEIPDSPIMNVEEKNKELTLALNKTNKELISLRGQYEDLKNLVKWLEKNNKELNDLLTSLHRIDQWMKNPDT